MSFIASGNPSNSMTNQRANRVGPRVAQKDFEAGMFRIAKKFAASVPTRAAGCKAPVPGEVEVWNRGVRVGSARIHDVAREDNKYKGSDELTYTIWF